MKTLVRIQKDVPLTIFDEPSLAKRIDDLFNGAEEKMKARIDAFSNAIRSIPIDSALSACLHGSKILLSEKEFLGKSYFQTFEKKKKDEQNNYCGECGCSCTCDGGCNGDTQKCTSKKATEKGCSHCCDCYIGPMLKNFPK